MKHKSTQHWNSLAFAVAALSLLVGCNATHHSLRQSSTNFCSPSNQPAKQSLRLVDVNSKKQIEIGSTSENYSTLLISEEPALEYRDLTFMECKQLAAMASPVSVALESHRDWLAKIDNPKDPMLFAFTCQAKYERSEHIGRALDAYLDLVEVLSQKPIVDRVLSVLTNADKALEKFQETGLSVPADSAEISQKKTQVDEQKCDLHFNEIRLNDGLEVLLKLEHQPNIPIWTNVELPGREIPRDECQAVATAMANRGDLLALEHLANHACDLSSDTLKGIASGASPLLGAPPSISSRGKWYVFFHRKEIENLKNLEKAERQRQLRAIAEVRRDQIRHEVYEVLHSLKHHHDLLILKQKRIIGLRANLESQAEAKDEVQVKLTDRLTDEITELRLAAEIVHEQIAIEKDLVRLERVTGVLQ